MTYLRVFSLVICFCFVFSCKNAEQEKINNAAGTMVDIKYAKGFSIMAFDDHYLVSVVDPLSAENILAKYYLYRGEEPKQKQEGLEYVSIPIHDLASLSTTHLPFLEALHVEEKLIAFSGVEYIYSEKISQLVEDKRILDIGTEGGFNEEVLVSLQPDIILAYNSGNPQYDQFDKMRSLKLTPILNNEYLELTPLGEAEWIKFVSLFFDKLQTAQQLFDEIAKEYNDIKSIADTISNKPSVFTGLAFKGEWTVPGGKSFAATFLKDAGANYIWQEDSKTGNFPVSFEEVISRAKQADIWLHPGASNSLQDISSADVRFNYFEAFRQGNVYNNNNRINSFGGNDYWESAVFAPQVVLQDLMKIFHPELMTAHTFVYYKHLE